MTGRGYVAPLKGNVRLATTLVRVGGRRRSRGLLFPLGDAGHNWRALLVGAPPGLL